MLGARIVNYQILELSHPVNECAKNCQSGLTQRICLQSNPLHKVELRLWLLLAILQLKQHQPDVRLGATAKITGFDPLSPGSESHVYNSVIRNMDHLVFEYILN